MLYDNVKNALRTAGLTVKLPGQYEAPCKEPYVVVHDGSLRSGAEKDDLQHVKNVCISY